MPHWVKVSVCVCVRHSLWKGKTLFKGCFYLPGLFHAFDENRDNHIDFKEISCGLSACCRGPIAERQKCKPWKHSRGFTLALIIFVVCVSPLKFYISSACENCGHIERPSCSSVLQVVLVTFFLLWFSSVCFKVFDVDHDGVLSRDELHEMVVALLEVWKDNRTDTLPVSLQEET